MRTKKKGAGANEGAKARRIMVEGRKEREMG